MRDLSGLAEATDWLPLVQLLADGVFFVAMILLQIPFDERGIDGSRTDAVHPQLLRVFDGKLARHGYNCTLRRTVREAFPDPDQTCNRPYINDRTLGGDQERNRVFSCKEGSIYIDAEQTLEVAEFCFFYPTDQTDTRIVDQNVE